MICYFVSDWKNDIEEDVEIIDVFQPNLNLILRDKFQRSFESIEYFIQGDVHVESASFAFANMIEIGFFQIRPEVPVFEAMGWNVQNSRQTKHPSTSSLEKSFALLIGIVKGILRSLTMMHIPVENQNSWTFDVDLDSFDPLNQFYFFKLYFSIAAFAVITTLLNRQKPLLSSLMAWWPGGRSRAKPFRH